ncbi:FixH family protein [Formosa sp. S-31]|uniref:FixH family protein n=1 Tax=Formosa sp. S-31 TaxID=2790949 RepID=UPI003EC07F0E
MKINWGTGIVIAFACFITFIMYFVITMITDDKYDHDLVVEDYYKQELNFQNDINKEKNSRSLVEDITYVHNSDGVLLKFPAQMSDNDVSGTISMYRPSNKALDFNLPLQIKDHSFLIPKERLVEGRWNLKVDWNYKNTNYLYKQLIVY